jgi:hypothetical protein
MTVEVPAAEPLVTIPDVEILRAGTWDLVTGQSTFTIADLASAAAAPVDCPSTRKPVLKLGHDEPTAGGIRWDGEPAVGWVDNLRTADGGATLVGDYVGVPSWLGDVIASAYPDRSAESEHQYRCQVGHTHLFVVHAVSLLGVTRPGIGNLNSLQDVAALYGVPSSAAVAVGEEGSVPSVQINAAVSSEDVRRKYFETAAWSEWITEVQLDPPQLIVTDDASGKMYRIPFEIDGDEVSFGDRKEVSVEYVDKSKVAAAIAAHRRLQFASHEESRPAPPDPAPPEPAPADAAETEQQEGGGVVPVLTDEQLARLRKLAGLPDTETDVTKIVAAAEAKLGGTVEPAPAGGQAEGDQEPDLVAASARRGPQPGVIQIDESAWQEMHEGLNRARRVGARLEARERDDTIDAAIQAGKFAPARKQHWAEAWDKDPEGTRRDIESLAAGRIPVEMLGHPGGLDDEDIDAEFAHLYPPVRVGTGG